MTLRCPAPRRTFVAPHTVPSVAPTPPPLWKAGDVQRDVLEVELPESDELAAEPRAPTGRRTTQVSVADVAGEVSAAVSLLTIASLLF
jgi:NADPH:quinone reductase-like Zn-dependent oxidoreductase